MDLGKAITSDIQQLRAYIQIMYIYDLFLFKREDIM